MSRPGGLAIWLAAALVVGCGGGSGGGGAMPGAGGAGGVPDGGGSDLPVPSDGTPPAETPPADSGPGPADQALVDLAGDLPATAEAIPAGDHFCLHKAASDAIAWYLGVDTTCVVTTAEPPPFTPAQKTAADYACKFYDSAATTPPSCPPREDMVGYCKVAPAPGPGLKAWRLIYKSKLQPDTAALALNPLAASCLPFDPSGKAIALPKCTGKVTAKVNDQLKDFSSKLYCTYKSDGAKAVYFIEADSPATDRLQLYIVKDGGTVAFLKNDPGTTINMGAGYLEGGTNPFVFPKDATTITLTATKFEEKGAGLAASFSLGDYKNGSNQVRTITEGSIDIKIEP